MIQIGTIPINFHLSRSLQITNVLCDKKKTIHCVFVSAKSAQNVVQIILTGSSH